MSLILLCGCPKQNANTRNAELFFSIYIYLHLSVRSVSKSILYHRSLYCTIARELQLTLTIPASAFCYGTTIRTEELLLID